MNVAPNKFAWSSGDVAWLTRDWNPFQPRVPRGESGGGQWSGENLTKAERAEVTYYTTKAYRHINSTLREGLAYVLDRTVPLLDSAIAKSVIGKDVTLFRGVNSDRFLAKMETLQPGDEFSDRAYMSASGSYLAAGLYAGVGRAVMEIKVPRGSNALYAESMSVSAGLGEEEYVLPRGSTLRYVGKVGKPGQVRYQFDYVPKSAKDWSPDQPRVPAGQHGGGQWRGENLSDEERAEVVNYTEDGYLFINEGLRAGEHQKSKGFRASIALMDSAIAKSVLDSDTVVYRGVNMLEFVDGLSALKPGDDLVDLAYMSTSGSATSAATFAGVMLGGGKSLMEVRLPAGSSALYVEEFSANQGEEEDEYILPRGTTLRYVTNRVTKTKKTIYTFDLVPKSAKDWSPFQPRVPKGQSGGGQWSGENLTAHERAAVQDYTQTGYARVNFKLRGGESYGPKVENIIAKLDSAIAKSVSDRDVKVYRGLGVGAKDFIETIKTMSEGDVIVDPGYLSTSHEYLQASFRGNRADVMEINVPRGSNVIYVESISSNQGENEYILPRGSQLKFTGSRKDSALSRETIYTFDLVPKSTRDSEWDESKHPRGEGGRFTHGQGVLSDDETRSIRMYSRQHYAGLNRHLRLGLPLTDTAEQIRRDLDAVFERSRLHTDATFYRGMGRSEKFYEAMKPGDEVVNLAYTSTSPEFMVAGIFSDFKSGVMEISVPRGTPAIDVGAVSGFEPEVLLPRSTTLRYLGRGAPRTSDKDVSRSYRFEVVRTGKALDWNPFQPRVPAGQKGGGEWTEGTSGAATGSLVGGEPKRGFDPVHVDALKQYTASIYHPVNKGLRDDTPLRTQEEAVVRALDEAFERAQRTTEVMQLFRAAGEEFADYVDQIKVGDELVDRGFVSTSFDENTARQFMADGGNKVLIEVVLPKNSRAIDTTPFNPFRGENETLLPRNTTFRYLGKERDVYRFRANPRPAA